MRWLAMVRLIRCLGIVALGCSALGCSDDVQVPSCGQGAMGNAWNEQVAGATGSLGAKPPDEPPAWTDEAKLCELTIGVSSPEQARAVLGPPDRSTDSGTSAGLWYGDASGVMIYLAFDGYVFTYASVHDAFFPKCWAQQLRELGGDADDAGVRGP